jgi:hypothetical protein
VSAADPEFADANDVLSKDGGYCLIESQLIIPPGCKGCANGDHLPQRYKDSGSSYSQASVPIKASEICRLYKSDVSISFDNINDITMLIPEESFNYYCDYPMIGLKHMVLAYRLHCNLNVELVELDGKLILQRLGK